MFMQIYKSVSLDSFTYTHPHSILLLNSFSSSSSSEKFFVTILFALFYTVILLPPATTPCPLTGDLILEAPSPKLKEQEVCWRWRWKFGVMSLLGSEERELWLGEPGNCWYCFSVIVRDVPILSVGRDAF